VYDILGKSWWALTLRGVAAVIFGILAITRPGVTLLALVTLFGAYAFVDGIFSLVAAFRAAEHHLHWMALVAEGVLGILVGIITFFHPALTATVFVIFIAVWAVITGVLELVAAVRLRREIAGEILLVLLGIVSVIFGVLLFIAPIEGAVAVVWILGIYALLFGVLMIILSLRLRSMQHGGVRRAAQGPA
jgi:uncharacterized membrane protein HdeD (DUF308 family)